MTETKVPTPTAALSAGAGNNESLMPPRRSGYVADGASGQEDNGSDGAQDYWFSLINEKAAVAFLVVFSGSALPQIEEIAVTLSGSTRPIVPNAARMVSPT